MNAEFTGIEISRRRKEKGLTQKQLADTLHVTDKAVSKWERGINFPDLQLLEPLAQVLDTTPAALLGLEQADSREALKAAAEISAEQLEEARRDIAVLAWGALAAAVLLSLAYSLAQRDSAGLYYLLSGLIFVLAQGSYLFLFRHGQIKKWGPRELGTFFGGILPLLVWLGYQFITGNALNPVISGALALFACTFTQIHFLQVMKPKFMKLLPLTASALYLIWQCILGGASPVLWLISSVCLGVLLIYGWKHPGFWKVDWRIVGIWVCVLLILVFIVCLLCWPQLVRIYLTANTDRLEQFAQTALEQGDDTHYGLLEVQVFPAQGLVLFYAGGSGLAPGAVYDGFYYAASGEHTAFPGFVPSEDYEGTVWFRDPDENSDNWQSSVRITDRFFWFGLHY